MDSRLESLRQAILGIDEAAALQATQELIDSGTDPRVILETGLTAALLELGRLWTCGDVFLPEVVAASAIFEQCSRLVEPVLEATSEPRLTQRFVLATVEGDLHDLGKNIVGAMMKTIGLEVHEDPYIVEGNDTPLAAGMAFSIEPGIYLPGRFGVRIEDIVVMGETGAERLNLSSRALTIVE